MWSAVRGRPRDGDDWTPGRDDRAPSPASPPREDCSLSWSSRRSIVVVVVVPQIRHREQKSLITGFTSIFDRRAANDRRSNQKLRADHRNPAALALNERKFPD